MPLRHPLVRLSLLLCLFASSCVTTKNDLPGLMVERLGWMDEVAQVKRAKNLPVTDAKREAELLAAMETRGAALGLPPHAVRALFAGQMDAAKQFQTEWLQSHKNSPSAASPLPDLARTVRPALDEIGGKMLAALATTRAASTAPQTLAATRERMRQAGYSTAVITPALKGLEAALMVKSVPPAGR